ncbi:hypothetical protein LZC95_19600 [Pendulispora brunnea]|uniref:Glycosyltransferase family 1 protein n=1 Tax=Pendulispora brunnea TaxID=2905690 RepID=A0ABZ2KK20_9BACT
MRVLRRNGVDARAYGVWTFEHVRERLWENNGVTHCIIEAPWLSAAETATLCHEFPDTHFLVRTHSNLGFLQVESGAITIIKELLLLQEGVLNLTVSANSQRLTHFIERTYQGKCLYLPNLYDTERVSRKRDFPSQHRLIRIGSWGAQRLMKNHTTAAAAAMLVAKSRASDLEFWVSTDREEFGRGIMASLRAMFKGLHWAKLVEHPWEDWAAFRRTVGYMDLNIQVSMSETFNIVSADSVAEGVPCVVSPMIEWAPPHWMCHPDAVEEMARIGTELLASVDGAADGLAALLRHVRHAVRRWLRYLDSQPDAIQSDDD